MRLCQKRAFPRKQLFPYAAEECIKLTWKNLASRVGIFQVWRVEINFLIQFCRTALFILLLLNVGREEIPHVGICIFIWTVLGYPCCPNPVHLLGAHVKPQWNLPQMTSKSSTVMQKMGCSTCFQVSVLEASEDREDSSYHMLWFK